MTRSSVPRDARAKWKKYRNVIYVIAFGLFVIDILAVVVATAQLLLKRSQPGAYESPHAFVMIPMFSTIHAGLLHVVAYTRRTAPAKQPTRRKLTLGLVTTILNALFLLVTTVIAIIFEALECGEFVCAISTPFSFFAYLFLIAIVLEFLADVVIFVLLLWMGRLTWLRRSGLGEETPEEEARELQKQLRYVQSVEEEDRAIPTDMGAPGVDDDIKLDY